MRKADGGQREGPGLPGLKCTTMVSRILGDALAQLITAGSVPTHASAKRKGPAVGAAGPASADGDGEGIYSARLASREMQHMNSRAAKRFPEPERAGHRIRQGAY